MREPEERQRHFVIPDKKEEDYDQPAVRRRGVMPDRGGRQDEDEEKPRKPRARRTLREREQEEEEEARSLRGSRKRRRIKQEDFDEEEYEDDEDSRPKAPKIVRIFAWAALIVILFTVGYVATNLFFAWSDKRTGERIGNVYGSGAEVAATAGNETAAQSRYNIYIPDGTSFQTRAIELKPGGTREEDIQRVLSMYVDSLKETKSLDPAVSVTSVFQSGEWLYVDLTEAFQSSIKQLKKEEATQLLNGMANTMRDNFPPVNKIKFYVNSKEFADKTPVDLTGAWEAR